MAAPKVCVTSVTVRRLWNLDNYENVVVEATATVNPGEDAAAVCIELRAWVEAQGTQKKRFGYWTYDPVTAAAESLEREMESLERETDEQQ